MWSPRPFMIQAAVWSFISERACLKNGQADFDMTYRRGGSAKPVVTSMFDSVDFKQLPVGMDKRPALGCCDCLFVRCLDLFGVGNCLVERSEERRVGDEGR